MSILGCGLIAVRIILYHSQHFCYSSEINLVQSKVFGVGVLLNVLNVVTLVAKVYASQRNLVCKTIYRIARKFRGVKFSWKLIRLSFRNFIFTDSNPIAIINDINIVSWIKIFVGGNKSAKTAKILPRETF